MNRFVKNLATLTLVTSVACGCKSMSLDTLSGAGKQGLAAATLTDAQVAEIADKGIKEMDAKFTIDPSSGAYAKRLATLTAAFTEARGQTLEFKVYRKDEINAFAMPNGSVRVYSGLMDAMTDNELLFVIGHEIGHVRMGHSRKRFQLAYATSAISEVVKQQGGKITDVASSEIGGFLETVVSAQFSQANEKDSDEYGLKILRRRKVDLNAAVTALQKLAKLSNAKPGILERMTSSHPDPSARAERLKAAIAEGK